MSVKKHTCNICNKDYKTPQSLWNHKNKIHDKFTENTQNNSTLTQDNSILTQDNSILTQENASFINLEQTNNINILICDYCKKEYSRKDNLNRHLTTCKAKVNIIKEKEELIKANDELKKEMEEIKQSFEKLKMAMILKWIVNVFDIDNICRYYLYAPPDSINI